MSRWAMPVLGLGLLCLVGCETLSTLPPAEPNANGCWVKIYGKEQFSQEGRWDLINGPGQWPQLYDLPGARYANWNDKIESIIVGPHARVTLWADDKFGGTVLELGPGRQVPKLRVYDFQHETESMKIEMAP